MGASLSKESIPDPLSPSTRSARRLPDGFPGPGARAYHRSRMAWGGAVMEGWAKTLRGGTQRSASPYAAART